MNNMSDDVVDAEILDPMSPLVIGGETYAQLVRALVKVTRDRRMDQPLVNALWSALNYDRVQVLHDLCEPIVPKTTDIYE